MVAAMRLTLHCFHRQHIINRVVFLYRHSFDVQTSENKIASLKKRNRIRNDRLKIIQNQTSLAINMRSVDTHQPKSTIFAHLLGLQSCLSPTKKGNKYATFPKTWPPTYEEQTQSKIRVYGEPICSQLRLFKMIRMLGKWREGRRPVGNHVGEWRAAPTERKYLATTPNSPD